MRALEVIEASRGAWHAELRAYGEMRLRAKRAGRRRPAAGEENPHYLTRWHGDERRAALHAVMFESRRKLAPLVVPGDPVAEQLKSCVDACLESAGALGVEEREALAECMRELEKRLTPAQWAEHRGEYFRASGLLRLARQVEVASAVTE
ncbi:hypothetical protein SAMN05421504_102386 [Amycolatopsis xylanica]|uniref:Uncharacterized protein n=2 Tax=Amycolatopsis xylanica TaxID=589385 RepID=A0A1H2Z5Q8_9PSEU|nr:hypothetical protein SAMN05421504_102386 [Amycolatopsis xylanica]